MIQRLIWKTGDFENINDFGWNINIENRVSISLIK